jgi:hypothetical protein
MDSAETKFFLTSEAARELEVAPGTFAVGRRKESLERSAAGRLRIFTGQELRRVKEARAAERK